jgi:hypothetical protein
MLMNNISRREFMKTMCLAGLGSVILGSEAWCAPIPEPTSEPTPIQYVHVIFKTHLDIGFTALAADVARNYFERYIPGAINLARRMRERGGPERFVWTTGSWLIYEYLEQASNKQRSEMERAIANGDIHWHALPFTTHTELMDADLARSALALSSRLDQRFGRRTVAAKMSDVPGHTRSLVPLLSGAGVKLLHIGVNRASKCPSVPPAFRWKAGKDASVVVLYTSGYGATHIIPGFDHALSFAHTGDNQGPQREERIIQVFRDLASRFPGARIQAGSMDEFAEAMTAGVIDSLPVVTAEIGDTWIYGAGSDPGNIARLREYMRMHSAWLAKDLTPAERAALEKADQSALLVCEHTWGLDVKSHLADWDKYDREAFNAVRTGEKYRLMESSWQEKRARIDAAIEVLAGSRLGVEARNAMEKLVPKPLSLDDYEKVNDANQMLEAGSFRLRFSPATGAIVSIIDPSGREWASSESPLGLVSYQGFSQAFYDEYYRYYNPDKEATSGWALKDFGKPGLDKTGACDQLAPARLTGLRKARHTNGSTCFALTLDFPDVKAPSYGHPGRVEILYEIGRKPFVIDIELCWFDKPPCRLPEALWFSFQPLFDASPCCTVSKLGLPVDVQDVVPDGNCFLHAVDDGGAIMQDRARTFHLRTLDAPLVAIGRRQLVKSDDLLPDTNGGLHVNLYNNLWGTNFRMWYGEDALFRFRMELPGV